MILKYNSVISDFGKSKNEIDGYWMSLLTNIQTRYSGDRNATNLVRNVFMQIFDKRDINAGKYFIRKP